MVTGENAGIGFETCKGLIESGFHVVACARSEEKGNAAVNALLGGAPAHSSTEALVLDLSSLDSVRAAAKAFLATGRPLHVCVLNAGIMALPWKTTADGFEQQWQVNVLATFSFAASSALPPGSNRAKPQAGRCGRAVWSLRFGSVSSPGGVG